MGKREILATAINNTESRLRFLTNGSPYGALHLFTHAEAGFRHHGHVELVPRTLDFRGHRKSSQKPSETNKIISLETPIPPLHPTPSYHVFRRAALLLYSQSLESWRRYRGHAMSLPWAVLCVEIFFIACSSGPIDRRKTRNNETKTNSSYYTSTSNGFHASSWTKISARRSTSARSETAPNSARILPNPPISVQWWGTELSRSCQSVLKLLVREEKTFTSERPVSQHAIVWDAIFV